MRFITHPVLSFVALIFLFSSCTKEVASTAPEPGIADKTSSTALTSVSGDTTTLILQPGADDGQDAYVNFLQARASYGQSNYNFLPEIGVSAWTIQGSPLKERTYINFTGLSALPKSAKILSATMYLYGLDPNTSASKPQGNSLYPGSPYSSYKNNGSIVSLVLGAWREDSITWRNKPDYQLTRKDAIIPSSTSQWNYDVSVNVKALVQIMADRQTFNGFCIHLQNEEIYRCMAFASSEATDASKRPKIVVMYTK